MHGSFIQTFPGINSGNLIPAGYEVTLVVKDICAQLYFSLTFQELCQPHTGMDMYP